MERLEGSVTGLAYERHEIGRGRAGRPPPVIHIYRFALAGRTVELRHGSALPLNEGDTVTVVCRARGGVARAYAWVNHTWGASLVEPSGIAAAMRGWLPAIPAMLAFVLAFFLWGEGAGLPARIGAIVAVLAGAGLSLWSVRGFIEYARYRRAARMLEG
ncbi:MAG: hypothetical protein U5K73_03555 [Halofilum sp. (in: g-proteobacteria)]|nr:hypothetical protein [Halofilum sp. (in: g-proteobacteria)]